jgi:hypothetical protein
MVSFREELIADVQLRWVPMRMSASTSGSSSASNT